MNRTRLIIIGIIGVAILAGIAGGAYLLTRDDRTFTRANLVDPNANAIYTKVNNLNIIQRMCDLSTSGIGSIEQYLSDSTTTDVTVDPYSITITGDDQGSHCVFYFTDNATATRYYADALYADPYVDTLTVSTADKSRVVNVYGN